MILVDTSVWIDFFRGKDTAQARILSESTAQYEDLCVSGIILAEVLQGIGSEAQYQRVKAAFDVFIFLPMSRNAYVLAADIYRRARSRGRTIRNTTDCLIAACAITHNTPLLQNDKDYQVIAGVSLLELVEFAD